MICTEFNQLAKEIHADCVAAGWWADMNRPIRRTLMLVISELSEAMEGDRKNLMDDHLPHRKMLEVELADACIRMLDLGGRYGWTYEGHCSVGIEPADSVAELLFECCHTVIALHNFNFDGQKNMINDMYSSFLNQCHELAKREGLDLFGAIHEKRIYNQQRADHKPAARAAQHGKKY
jgi:hypothetical protein